MKSQIDHMPCARMCYVATGFLGSHRPGRHAHSSDYSDLHSVQQAGFKTSLPAADIQASSVLTQLSASETVPTDLDDGVPDGGSCRSRRACHAG